MAVKLVSVSLSLASSLVDTTTVATSLMASQTRTPALLTAHTMRTQHSGTRTPSMVYAAMSKPAWMPPSTGSSGHGRYVHLELRNLFFVLIPPLQIGDSTVRGHMACPLWSYSHGLRGGWIPKDPRTAYGTCASLGGANVVFAGTYAASATGANPSASLAPEVSASFGQWPPTSINGVGAQVTLAPSYTPTGPIHTLSQPSLTPAPTPSADAGDGWFDDNDTAGGMTTVAGCAYQDAWDSAAHSMPAAACTGA